MWAVVHNPSSIDMQTQRFALPHGNYSAEVFDFDMNSFKQVPSNILCHNDTWNQTELLSCFLAVKVRTNSSQFSFVKINRLGDSTEAPKDLFIGNSIENEMIKLTYTGFSTDTFVQIEITNKPLNKSEQVLVGLGHYTSYRSFNHF